MLVTDEERGRVRPPLDREDGSRKVDLEVGAFPGADVPDGRPLEGTQLARERQPLVSRDRRPSVRFEVRPGIDEVAPHGSRAGVEDAKRQMQDVAPLGVPDAHERPVRGETARLRIRAADPARERCGPEEAWILAFVDDVDPIVALYLHADGGPDRVEREPREPPVREIRQDGFGDAAGRRPDQPAPLVAGPIAPPGEAAIGERPDPLVHADGFVAQLLPRFRAEIVGPYLRGAAERADEREQVGVRRRPHGDPSSGAVKRRTQARSSVIGA